MRSTVLGHTRPGYRIRRAAVLTPSIWVLRIGSFIDGATCLAGVFYLVMNESLKQQVRDRTGNHCEYCRIHQDQEPFYTVPVDHVTNHY